MWQSVPANHADPDLFQMFLGGPKLRRWYGAPDLLPKDGGAEDEEEDSPGT